MCVCVYVGCVCEGERQRRGGREGEVKDVQRKRMGKERRKRVLHALVNSSAFLLSCYSLICSHRLFPSFYFLTSQGCA